MAHLCCDVNQPNLGRELVCGAEINPTLFILHSVIAAITLLESIAFLIVGSQLANHDRAAQIETVDHEMINYARVGQGDAVACAIGQLKSLPVQEGELQRIEKYGPSSEKLSSLQLELLEQEPGVSRQEVVAESQRPAPPPATERKKRPHPGRQTLPADLPRVERVIACTPEQCVCGNCGRDTTLMGYEVSEVLNVEAARYFVEVTKREKRACKTCPEQGVMAAPLPDRIIDKSLVSDEVIINTVVNKYCDHAPLYRQSVALLRDAGIDISRATMCGWVMTIGEMLMPVVGAMRSQGAVRYLHPGR